MAQMQLTLQPRLQAIADLVPQGSRIADVGTDHGYLPIIYCSATGFHAPLLLTFAQAP